MKRKTKRKRASTMPGAGPLLCHCGRPAVLRDAREVCKCNRPGAMAYVCSNYPACNSFVLAHPGTLEPMGPLAGPELRRLRSEAHRHFDRLHQCGLMSRRAAYQWLAYIVQAPMSHAHIAHLGEYYCKVVIEESKKLLEQKLAIQDPTEHIAGGEDYAAPDECAAS